MLPVILVVFELYIEIDIFKQITKCCAGPETKNFLGTFVLL